MIRIGRTAKLLCSSGFVLAATWAQPYRPVVVSGHSMEPTYQDGSIVVEQRGPAKFAKGDVVVINHDGSTIIKRVAKIPGELYREAYYLGRWHAIETESEYNWAKGRKLDIRWANIPFDAVYVLGDNSVNSTDSRQLGPIPLDEVQGKLVRPRAYNPDAINAYQYRFFGALTD